MNQPTLQAVKENIQKVIIGKSEVIDLIVTSLLAGGHVLLEDVPGTGKTVMAKSLARSLKARFGRIQFTPDLLPSDVTGLNYFNQKQGEFVFKEGPVFCNILLADEINRATPRTQSSLLECMEERQVTVDGETRILGRPFFVIATQNPVETTGTFPLPEAQLDRFFMKISMGMPSKTEEIDILNRFMQNQPLEQLDSVCTSEELIKMQNEYQQVFVHPVLIEYMVHLTQGTRKQQGVVSGVSPRGSLAFLRAVQAYAYIAGRDFVVPEDIKAVASPVLAHRIIVNRGFGVSGEQIVEEVLQHTEVPVEEWKRQEAL